MPNPTLQLGNVFSAHDHHGGVSWAFHRNKLNFNIKNHNHIVRYPGLQCIGVILAEYIAFFLYCLYKTVTGVRTCVLCMFYHMDL